MCSLRSPMFSHQRPFPAPSPWISTIVLDASATPMAGPVEASTVPSPSTTLWRNGRPPPRVRSINASAVLRRVQVAGSHAGLNQKATSRTSDPAAQTSCLASAAVGLQAPAPGSAAALPPHWLALDMTITVCTSTAAVGASSAHGRGVTTVPEAANAPLAAAASRILANQEISVATIPAGLQNSSF